MIPEQFAYWLNGILQFKERIEEKYYCDQGVDDSQLKKIIYDLIEQKFKQVILDKETKC